MLYLIDMPGGAFLAVLTGNSYFPKRWKKNGLNLRRKTFLLAFEMKGIFHFLVVLKMFDRVIF